MMAGGKPLLFLCAALFLFFSVSQTFSIAARQKDFSFSSQDGRLSVFCPDVAEAETWFRQIESKSRRFDSLMPDGDKWKSPIHFHVQSKLGNTTPSLRSSAVIKQGRLVFHLWITRPSELHRANIEAAIAEQFCYEFATRRLSHPEPDGILPKIPFWIVDGMGSLIEPWDQRNWGRVVQGISRRKKAPTLAAMESWKNPSNDDLERILQQSFSFWLVRELVFAPEDKRRLADWLANITAQKEEEPIFWGEDPAISEKWWCSTLEKSTRGTVSEQFLTLESSHAELVRLLPTPMKDMRTGAVRLLMPRQIFSGRPDSQFFSQLSEKQRLLLQLAQRCDPVYQPVVEAYLEAFTCLLLRKDAAFADKIQRAELLTKETHAFRAELGEYMDWFEVARSNARPESDFAAYFQHRSRMERKDADASELALFRGD